MTDTHTHTQETTGYFQCECGLAAWPLMLRGDSWLVPPDGSLNLTISSQWWVNDAHHICYNLHIMSLHHLFCHFILTSVSLASFSTLSMDCVVHMKSVHVAAARRMTKHWSSYSWNVTSSSRNSPCRYQNDFHAVGIFTSDSLQQALLCTVKQIISQTINLQTVSTFNGIIAPAVDNMTLETRPACNEV